MVQTEFNFEEIFSKKVQDKIKEEYDRLKDLCYLDHTGSAPYSKSHMLSVMNDLMENVYSNPHSGSLTGKHCSDSIDQVRYRILQHFNTDIDEYSVIFTSGATAALKLVAESFCWTSLDPEYVKDDWYPKEQCTTNNQGDFIYMEDNHTSVLGMRDLVHNRGANVKCLQHNETLDIFLNDSCRTDQIQSVNTNSLFVYSAQCNFSGVKYPLTWIEKVQNGILEGTCGRASNWYCLLDAATYISTNQLDLKIYKPDFVCLSFYKLFGYPTGLGALLVRNSSAHVLYKTYYGGGTVQIALSSQRAYVPRPLLYDRFEDGTLNFLSIISLNSGLDALYSLIGNMDNVSRHCFNLAKYLFFSLLKLHHSNGSPAIHLYADSPYDNVNIQGNIVNFNILRPNGDFIGYAEVLHMANLYGIQLRTGCFCNPGACRRHLGLTNKDLRQHYQAGHVCGDDKDLVNGYPTGSVRVSFGYYSTKEDADKLLDMIEKCFVKQPKIQRVPFLWDFIASCLTHKFNPAENKIAKIKHSDFLEFIHGSSDYKGDILPETILDNKFTYFDKVQKSDAETVVERRDKSYLSHIFLYPIKSCGRFAVHKWQLTNKGLKYDRNWMIVDNSGVALTQKRVSKMCMIRPTIHLNTNKLSLSFEGHPDVSVDLENVSDNYKSDLSFCQSKVCGDRIQGVDCGDEVADWLSSVLNRPGLRLIRQSDEDGRRHKKSSGSLTLANQGQYLLINVESVKWLADQLDGTDCHKESMLDRFRCNFAISDLEASFIEQEWKNVNIGNTDFTVDGLCGRCQMICINQDTGEYSKEPLTLLSANLNGKIKFGIYLSKITRDDITLSVGDPFIAFK